MFVFVLEPDPAFINTELFRRLHSVSILTIRIANANVNQSASNFFVQLGVSRHTITDDEGFLVCFSVLLFLGMSSKLDSGWKQKDERGKGDDMQQMERNTYSFLCR